MITKLDFIGIPSTDADRSRAFYVETLGLRPDEHGRYEFWAGGTCFAVWEPAKQGMEFMPQKNAHPALHVEDVAAAREELEAKGVEFAKEPHTIRPGTRICFIRGPQGISIELLERDKKYA